MAETSRQAETQLADLLAHCAMGDQRAFAELYDATAAKLFGIVLRIVHREVWAEEALQEAYLKIWSGAGGYSGVRGRPMTWMISIARNQALDYARRSESRWSDLAVEADETLPSSSAPQREAEVSLELERLSRCLALLTADQRACFLLVYHQGFTPTEVSGARNWPLGTVKTWIRRGLQRLWECLG